MAGLVRGACVTGGWSLTQEARDGTVARLTDTLLATSFHWHKDIGDPASRAKSVEARAYATAQVASTTTTGDRPHVEGVRIYTREAGKLVQALLQGAQEAGLGARGGTAAAAADPLSLSLHSNDREFLTAERATELLAPLLAHGSKVTKVKLSTKSFGRDAAQVAAAAFSAVKATLREVDLSDVLAGRPEAEALEALGIMCSALSADNGVTLDALDLSDNALGEKGVRAAAPALKGQPHLKSLALQNDGISAHAAAALGEVLASRESLASLRLYNNMTGDEGALHVAALLSKCPNLCELRLVSSRVQTQGGTALAAALAGLGGKALAKLDLCDNGLGPECGAPLAAVVATHPGLTVLLLNECGLCDEGVAPLAAALKGHPGLTRLELCCNEITPEGAASLAAVLPTLARLTALRLAENELGDEGAAILAKALHAAPGLPDLGELDFGSNELHGTGARPLGAAAASRKCAKLGLDGNEIGAGSVAAVAKLLAACGGELGPMDDNDPDADDGDEGDDVDLDFGKATL